MRRPAVNVFESSIAGPHHKTTAKPSSTQTPQAHMEVRGSAPNQKRVLGALGYELAD